MAEIVEIPIELTHFQFPEGVKERLNFLLDRQDAGEKLTQSGSRRIG
jgi:ribosome assembly protein YihI (activator of Der GTPase)